MKQLTATAALLVSCSMTIPVYAQQVVPPINNGSGALAPSINNEPTFVPDLGAIPADVKAKIEGTDRADNVNSSPSPNPTAAQNGNASVNPASGVAFEIAPPPVINPINQQHVRLTDKEREGVKITQDWRHHASNPATGENGAVLFTYGATQPSIVCAPLTVCLLKLQPGERILPHGQHLGDRTRWKVVPAITANNQTVLVIKPTDAALKTNLAVMTDRHVYSIRLVSVQSDAQSMAISEFRYPAEEAAEWQAYYAQIEAEKQKAEKAKEREIENNTLSTGQNIATLDFKYRIESVKGGEVLWKPTRIYNDGVHTYIRFPEIMRSIDAPSLLVMSAHSNSELVNYRKEGDAYVVDKLFEKAELVEGVGHKRSQVIISHYGAFK